MADKTIQCPAESDAHAVADFFDTLAARKLSPDECMDLTRIWLANKPTIPAAKDAPSVLPPR